MRYLSVFSGIEAASVAWHDFGWTPVGFSEIEPFPCAVLKHRFPNVPNYGDITRHAEWPLSAGDVDILIGGSPCQSFSRAGFKQGLADPRGNLALVFLAVADRLKPKWIIWENVPGALSSNGGEDFSTILWALAEIGYCCAWRVLDARHFGIPQRRRRIWLVGYRNPVTGLGDWRPPAEALFDEQPVLGHHPNIGTEEKDGSISADACAEEMLRIPVAFQPGNLRRKAGSDPSFEVFPTLKAGIGDQSPHVAWNGVARRLSAREVERVQGFPDDWTMIGWKGKSSEECPDEPRYTAVGNSMAVPCVRWVGSRIKIVESKCT